MDMRKHALIAALALACSMASPAQATPSYSPTYVAVSTFTPGAELSYPFAFKNASSLVDVKVQRIEVASCSTRTVVGGLMQFYIIPSTTITPGVVTQVSTYTYDANWTYPLNVSASRTPTTISFEGSQSYPQPFSRSLVINNDETATDHFSDAWDAREGNEEPQAMVLLKGRNRGFALQLRRLGTTDWADGCVLVKVVFTAK